MSRRIRLKHHQLAAELAKRSISQNRWAQILGLGRAHLSLLVNGKRPHPNRETREKLLRGLDVPFATLFEIEDERTAPRRPRWLPAPRTGDRRRGSVMDKLAQDLRFAVRSLLRRPVFSIVVIAVLALAIGANAATFSWVRGLVLDPLRVSDPDRFVSLTIVQPSGFQTSFSNPNFVDYRDSGPFREVWATRLTPVSVSTGRENQRAYAMLASASYFRALGQAPELGRVYTADEDRVPGRDAVVVLGWGFWQRRFAGDPGIVGAALSINGASYTVIGVMPREFGFARVEPAADMWIPLVMQEQVRPGTGTLEERTSSFLQAFAVLPEGADIESIRDPLEAFHAALAQEHPEALEGTRPGMVPAGEALFGPDNGHVVGALMLMLLLLVAGVLLIACANAAGMMLARAVDRSHEVGVRQALGASRSRLVQQLLTESLVLSLAAAGGGVLLALVLNRLIFSFQPPFPFALNIGIDLDGAVLAYAVAAAVATGVLFGVWPALQVTRGSAAPVVLRGSGRITAGTRARSALVAVQVALSVALIASAGLFVRSMQSATSIDPGFEPRGMVVAALDPGLQGYTDDEVDSFYRRLVDNVSALPGVSAVALAEVVPMTLGSQQWGTTVEGYEPAEDERMNFDYNFIGPDYFSVMGIGLLSGREFRWSDDADGSGVVIVNETMARRFWADESALGKRIHSGGMWREVVGVVADSKVYSLGEDPFPMLYFPYLQSRQSALALHVRSATDVEQLSRQVRDAVRALDPDLPLFDLRTMGDQVALALLPARMAAGVLGGFGGFALLLAAIGMYGMLAYSVSRRSREIGIRMALGADRGSVLRMVVRQAVLLGVVGAGFGLLLAALIGRAAAGLLYGIGWLDPAALGGSLAVIAAAVLASGALPARRATAVDPVEALRQE